MKRFFLPTILLMLAIALTACGGAVKNTDQNKPVANPSAVQNEEANSPASPENAEGVQANTKDSKAPEIKPADKSTVSENKGTSNGKQPVVKNNISVITKSDNAVSSAEKEKVLKDLDSEVNGMLKDIDKLDEVSDADLAE